MPINRLEKGLSITDEPDGEETPWITDIEDMGDALKEHIVEEIIPAYIPNMIKPLIEEAAASIMAQMGRMMERELEKCLNNHLDSLRTDCQTMVEAHFNKCAAPKIAEITAQIISLPMLLESLLSNLPVPQINVALPEMNVSNHFEVPPDSINLQMNTPEIIVNVPQQEAPTVHIDNHNTAPEIHVQPTPVNIQNKMDSPNIEINVPEQEAPVIHVDIPKRRTRKTIEYLEDGRPSVITEEEI